MWGRDRKRHPLSFQYLYESGVVAFDNQIKELASSWAQAGIKLQLEPKAFGDVISTAATPCVPARHVRGRSPTGAADGSTGRTTTRQVRRSSPAAPVRTSAATPIPRPTRSSRRRTPPRRWRRCTTTRTTSRRTSPESGSRAPSSGWRRSARTSAASHPKIRSSPGSQKTGTSASRPGSGPGQMPLRCRSRHVPPVSGRGRPSGSTHDGELVERVTSRWRTRPVSIQGRGKMVTKT